MLLVILHMYTRTPSISTLPSPSYHWPSVRGTHRDERQVRGFQEWQPAFARSHIRIVGNPDVTKHSETYQESVRNTTPLNTRISAKKCTAATTLRLAWSHPLSYPIHPVRRHPTTRTSPHKSVLIPSPHRQSSIYALSINHNDLAHIPDLSKCCQMGLSICPMYRPPNLRFPF